MTSNRGRSTSPQTPSSAPHASGLGYAEDDSILNTRQIEAFGRTVQATASQLISTNFPQTDGDPYHAALTSMQRSLRRPMIQRSVFSFAKANPRELIRSNFDTSEIEHRAITYLPDELLRNIPQTRSPFSLLDGFRASLPEDSSLADRVNKRRKGKHGRKESRLLEDSDRGPPQLKTLRREKDRLDHRLEMMGIRKTMCASEIKEIDDKIANLNTMRRVCLDRLADLEQEEHDLDQEVAELSGRIEDLAEEAEDEAALAEGSDSRRGDITPIEEEEEEDTGGGFMSESIYEKLPKIGSSSPSSPTSKSKRRRPLPRRVSMPVLHEHMEPGSRIREMQAHNDIITALDFDAPFGTMVTAALDDTVRVWDLNAGRCMGLLEGHLSSVRCLQVEDNIVATGSMDASIRLWDLGMADYTPPPPSNHISHKASHSSKEHEESATDAEPATGEDLFTLAPGTSSPPEESFATPPAEAEEYHPNAMADCSLMSLQAHVAEITALHFRGSTLVSGSADKTLRQWDLEKGRCVQTLDVLWAAAQQASTVDSSKAGSTGSSSSGGGGSWWRPTQGRVTSAEADFIGALQVFDAALACGTADGMVRLWDLRSGAVSRSLVGHTGPITSLQFDDVFLVTGSGDRSIRIWDLRTGTIYDAFAYDNPISSMMFDARRIVAAAGEDVVKVYDKTEGRHWDCGAGASSGTDEGRVKASVVEKVRIRDGYLVEGRRDGVVGVWSC